MHESSHTGFAQCLRMGCDAEVLRTEEFCEPCWGRVPRRMRFKVALHHKRAKSGREDWRRYREAFRAALAFMGEESHA